MFYSSGGAFFALGRKQAILLYIKPFFFIFELAQENSILCIFLFGQNGLCPAHSFYSSWQFTEQKPMNFTICSDCLKYCFQSCLMTCSTISASHFFFSCNFPSLLMMVSLPEIKLFHPTSKALACFQWTNPLRMWQKAVLECYSWLRGCIEFLEHCYSLSTQPWLLLMTQGKVLSFILSSPLNWGNNILYTGKGDKDCNVTP